MSYLLSFIFRPMFSFWTREDCSTCHCSASPEGQSSLNLNTDRFRRFGYLSRRYTLLSPADVPRFLGCRIINGQATGYVLSVGHIMPGPPLSTKDLATREELIRWLNRHLVNTLSPGKPHPGTIRVRAPNNLVAFVNLLVHLCNFGFPAHWISDYVQGMLADKVVTGAIPARDLPIPVGDGQGVDRKLGLGPWLAELETVLASVRKGLPFFVSLPSDSGILVAAELEDIGKFEAKVRTFPELRAMQHIFSPYDPIATLLFWKPSLSSGRNEQALKREGEKIIKQEVDGVLLSGGQISSKWDRKFVVLTSQESVEQDKSVCWRMAKRRVERMRKEGWVMMVTTCDFRMAGTFLLPRLPLPALLSSFLVPLVCSDKACARFGMVGAPGSRLALMNDPPNGPCGLSVSSLFLSFRSSRSIALSTFCTIAT